MKFFINTTPESEQDIADAYFWYNNQRVGLGKDFVMVILAELNFIARSPYINPTVFKNIRYRPLRRFPYSIYYVVKKSEIDIIAIAHQKRHPSTWKKRPY